MAYIFISFGECRSCTFHIVITHVTLLIRLTNKHNASFISYVVDRVSLNPNTKVVKILLTSLTDRQKSAF